MKFPNYKIEEKKGVLRWYNWHDFIKNIKKIRYNRENNQIAIAIVILFYSSLKNIIIILDHINKEKNKEKFDIIIINNSGLQENIITLEKESINNNIIIIDPVANLGTDGGYAIGIEYAVESNYDFVYLVEDDIILLDEQTFSVMYDRQTKKEIAFINGGKNDPYIHSWYFQLASYPIEFIKKCGNIDPRFFTRGGDGERRPKIEKNIIKYGYKKIIIDKNYLHPTLKKSNGGAWWIYFVIRNYFFMLQKNALNLSLTIYIFRSIFIYIRYGLSKLLLEKSAVIIRVYIYAMKDFLTENWNLNTNLLRIAVLSGEKIPLPKNLQEFTLDKQSDIDSYTKNLYYNKLFSKQDLGNFKHSKDTKKIFTSGIFISNFYGALYPLFILSKRIFSLDEFIFNNGSMKISYLENKLQYRYIKSFFSFVISIPIFVIIIILVYLKTLVKKFYCINKFIGKYRKIINIT